MRMPSCKQHVRQIFFVETTQMSSSSTSWCFRNSEWLRQDLIPRISPQRDWCNVFPRYFCNSNSNHFLAVLAAWENSRAVYDIIQTSLFYYFCDLYISEVEKIISTETCFRFWISLQILGLPNYLPTSCRTATVTQAANQKYSSQSVIPESLRALTRWPKSPRTLGTRLVTHRWGHRGKMSAQAWPTRESSPRARDWYQSNLA